jgi:very-short-patch-repair endonuclease
MGEGRPFIGSEALATGAVNRHELRRYYRPVMPNVYLDKRAQPSLQDRTCAAWLWSRRRGVVAGLAAAALHGARWVDDDVPVELIYCNARAPQGVVTRNELLFEEETQRLDGLSVTTPERTAFDLGRRDRIERAVERLDSLSRATDFKVPAVAELAAKHGHARGLRQLEAALDLVDAGAESPRETALRLLLIGAGYPRPRTQIPVLSPDGYRQYYLDMGWEDLMLAMEYDGDHHRLDRARFAYEIERAEDINAVGWLVIRVAARSRRADVLRRVARAWDVRTR